MHIQQSWMGDEANGNERPSDIVVLYPSSVYHDIGKMYCKANKITPKEAVEMLYIGRYPNFRVDTSNLPDEML